MSLGVNQVATHPIAKTPLPPRYPPNPLVDKAHEWLGGPQFGPRLTPAQKNRMKRYGEKRDGRRCMGCGKPVEDILKLTVHHVDGNPGNNYSDNVLIMEWECNNAAQHGTIPPTGILGSPVSSLPTSPPKQ